MICCYVDGGYDNVRKRNGYGSFAVFKDGTQLGFEHFKLPEASSSNQAEYLSLLRLLDWLSTTHLPVDVIRINSDSQLMLRQITGEYRVKNPELIKLHQLVVLPENCELHWIPRKVNVRILGH